MTSNKLKSTLLLGLFLLISSVSYGQVIKMRTSSIAYRYISEYNDWTDWSDFEEVSALVVIDIDRERITIYTKETQVYDIVKYEGSEVDSDGDDIMSFFCVDDDGDACGIDLVKLNSRNGQNQLYVRFADLQFAYYVNVLD